MLLQLFGWCWQYKYDNVCCENTISYVEMKLLIVLFTVLAVVLNIIMPASGMNHCNCNPCPGDAPYEIKRLRGINDAQPFYPSQNYGQNFNRPQQPFSTYGFNTYG